MERRDIEDRCHQPLWVQGVCHQSVFNLPCQVEVCRHRRGFGLDWQSDQEAVLGRLVAHVTGGLDHVKNIRERKGFESEVDDEERLPWLKLVVVRRKCAVFNSLFVTIHKY